MKIDFCPSSRAIVVGLMSGTSADGIDAAVLEMWQEGVAVRWRLLHHESAPWPPELRSAILRACRPDAPVREVTALNFCLGEEFARAAIAAVQMAGIALADVTAIASHGQTIWHQPEPLRIGGVRSVGTMQIGEAAVIAARTGRLVVSDFRCADMAVGGQGAPLVPFADFLLFADDEEIRAVQNIGGIANVTLLSAGGSLSDVVAFDTGPGNMVLDALAMRASDGRQQFDLDGNLASKGHTDRELLAELLGHAFFRAAPPKSTGREDFGASFSEALWERGRDRGLSPADVMATAMALTVESISTAYGKFLLPRGRIDRVIIGGGGVRNPVMVDALRAALAPAEIVRHVDFGLPDEAKEAAAFALLGYHTLRGRASNVPSATGARTAAILGKIAFPPPELLQV